MTLNHFRKILGRIIQKNDFIPLMEADVSAFLYHTFLCNSICVNKLHLNTRVDGSKKNKRYDLAIGEISEKDNKRPAILPEVVIEIKAFPKGFTQQQHRVHFEHVLKDDLPKLGRLVSKNIIKIELLWDCENYIYKKNSRLEVLRKTRKSVDQSIHILHVNSKKRTVTLVSN